MTDNERKILAHDMRWGSDGYPVHQYQNGSWTWGPWFDVDINATWPTKREAVASFEGYLEGIRRRHSAEVRANA